jgi:hypothetical protein
MRERDANSDRREWRLLDRTGPALVSFRRRDLVMRQLGPHGIEDAVTPDERMEQRRGDMHQDQREEEEGEIEIRSVCRPGFRGRICGSQTPGHNTTGYSAADSIAQPISGIAIMSA